MKLGVLSKGVPQGVPGVTVLTVTSQIMLNTSLKASLTPKPPGNEAWTCVGRTA